MIVSERERAWPGAPGGACGRRDLDVNAGDAEVPVRVAAGAASSAASGSGSVSRRSPVIPCSVRVDRDLVRGEHRGWARTPAASPSGSAVSVTPFVARACAGASGVQDALGRAQRLLPLFLRVAYRRRDRLQFLLEPVDVGLRALARLLLFGRRQIEPAFEVARAVAERAALVVRVGEEGEQPEVVLLAEGIVLVVVALRARRACVPSQTVAVVLTRSTSTSYIDSSGSTPPSSLVIALR